MEKDKKDKKDELGVVIIYGRGADLGNFKFFADDLVPTELNGFDKKNIVIKNIERRDEFFDFLRNTKFPFKIKELHIYSHSIGGGLFLAYKDKELISARIDFQDKKTGSPANYQSVLGVEKGTIFSDDFSRDPYKGYKSTLRSLFAKGAKIKIWGCNSGVSGWVYTDNPDIIEGSDDSCYSNRNGYCYYWRALNEMNVPKPSVAQAFADYFGVDTYGALSGSSIQAQYKGTWMSLKDYQKATKKKSVGEQDILRLNPDSGPYHVFHHKK